MVRVVSVEGLPCASRDMVLKHVQARANVPTLPAVAPPKTDEPHVASLAFLLAQARALKHVGPEAVALSLSSWLDKTAGIDAGLYDTLAGCLKRRLGLPTEGTLDMVYLKVDPHEAFECMIDKGAEYRHLSLRHVLDLDRRLDEFCRRPNGRLFYETRVKTVPCRPFMADAPREVEEVARAVLKIVAGVESSL